MESKMTYLAIERLILIAQKHFQGVQFTTERRILSFEFSHMLADFDTVRKDFENEGFYAFLRKEKEKNICILVRIKEVEPAKKSLLITLFLLTFLTTTAAGYYFSYGLVEAGQMSNIWIGALSFSCGLLLILGSHELGHKLISNKNEVPANGPYFIPVPPFILPLGTLGAIIKIRSPMPDKNSQVRLGVAGPFTGIFFSVIVLLVGLKLSFIVEPQVLGKGIELGNSLLLKLLQLTVIDIPEGSSLSLHPLAFAGWVGLFVTFLNLIPVGQLDGGHVARAVLGGRNHMRLSLFICSLMFTVGMLGFLGYPVWPGWMVWGIFGFFFSMGGNPGAMNELKPLGKQEKIMALIAAIIFILTFMPVPIKMG
jgi:membrane-associated protease RseP (regulator of RpoE activity)